jgi:hypothetical protein
MATRTAIRGSRSLTTSARKGFQIEGFQEVIDKVANVATLMTGPKIKKLLYTVALPIADEIRSRARFDPKREKGFHIRESVFVSEGDPSKADVLVGVSHKKAPHAWLQEYDPVRGKPYMRPALVAAGPKAAADLKSGLTEIANEGFKR